ncbi:MAG: GNAT family N-acetyltransferase [bacterium]
MLGEITYREIGIERFNDLIDLFVKSGLPYKPLGIDSRAEVEKQMRSEYESFIGAFDGNKMIGFVLATFDSRKGWINCLCVLPEYRDGRGVAVGLVNEAKRVLNEMGADIISVLIEEDNLPSLAFFRRMGYILSRHIFYLSKRNSSET